MTMNARGWHCVLALGLRTCLADLLDRLCCKVQSHAQPLLLGFSQWVKHPEEPQKPDPLTGYCCCH